MSETILGKLARGFGRVFGSRNDRVLKKIQPIVRRINEIEAEYQRLTEDELRAKTDEFRQRLSAGETLDELLPETFAAVKNACRRLVGREWTILGNPYRWFMIPFDVQLVGGVVLHRGAVAEMDTGEGKTLVATMPAYLNALTGRGVHVVTVNDYLAQRDREWVGPVYELLGLTVGVIQSEMDPHQRQPEYAADIAYGTNNEFGFDYLRDNMKPSKDVQVQRELHYAIIDEADSILIDEARTPLIISGPAYETTDKFYTADKVARRLRSGTHFEVKEKEHTCHLTEDGILEAQKQLKVDDFYTGDNMDWPHLLDQALRAHHLFKRDKEYILREGRVCIVDEHTGRLMADRTWSDGLHQAIEAKEHLKIREENQTLATITLQNYFRLYEKTAGMTGTAMTEAAEFWHIYKMDVVTIPTNRPSGRVNHPDRIFLTEPEKYEAVVEEIIRAHRSGRPLLVGTISIENSEKLSGMLKRRGIEHDVLNAKQHRREAEIVKGAGEFGRVTLATTMAGRGTDIVLGRDPGHADRLSRDEFADEYADVDPETLAHMREVQATPDGDGDGYRGLVAELGGLYVIGTERHEARRIDNQLRGRCGRQGDPGDSRFFASLEDDLMRVFAGDWVRSFLARLGMGQGQAIDSPMVSRQIAKAQKRVEEANFSRRKNILEYDMVMDEQRRIIYGQRQDILEGKDLHGMVRDMLEEVVETNVPLYVDDSVRPEERDYKGLVNWANAKFALEVAPDDVWQKNSDDLIDLFTGRVRDLLDERERALGAGRMRELERYLLLQIIDVKWKDHLHAMDQLRSGIGLRAYAQKDPKVEYKLEAYEMFQAMTDAIKDEVASLVLRVQMVEDYRERAADIWQVSDVVHSEVGQFETSGMAEAAEASVGGEAAKPFVRPGKKVGRNDPCPCGSGKKYKKCCGAAG